MKCAVKTPFFRQLGALVQDERTTQFTVWAPFHKKLAVEVVGKKSFPMEKSDDGYFSCAAEGVGPSDSYYYLFEDGTRRSDPISNFLPKGLHGPSEVVDQSAFVFDDLSWKGFELSEGVFYELHVGTFTKRGSFLGIIEKLDYLKELGVTCIELMPIAQFPGRWNWGYDGASLFAVQNTYGKPDDLKALVNECHKKGLGVCLDVVYNHLGPEGNYLGQFGPYFSDTYQTPWGQAFNYDGPHSDHVREYVIQNALHWVEEYHIDALRLDALHGIFDSSATPFLSDLVKRVAAASQRLDRSLYLIGESDKNDGRLLKEVGLNALWNDDFHHAAHVLLCGEKEGYYVDFNGIDDLKKGVKQGFVYDGQYSTFRKRRQGNSPEGIGLEQFVVFVQNHDQIGNRPSADRFSTLIEPNRLALAAFLNLLTPSIPLIFMGQEYGEKAPFDYFVDYEDKQMIEAVHAGRKKEFARDDMPYPGEESFKRSHLTWQYDQKLLSLYKTLLSIRKEHPSKSGHKIEVYGSDQEAFLAWEYQTQEGRWLGVALSFDPASTSCPFPFVHVKGEKLLYATEGSCVDFVGKKVDFLSTDGIVFL